MAKILLVEDDENLGFLMQESLEGLQHEVNWCKDGQAAFSKFKEESHQLCLLDIMMPKMDGFDLARKIRAMDELIPILFLTAKSQEEDRLKGFEVGADDYISKPFSMKELSYRINVFLRRSTVATSKATCDHCLYFGSSSFDSLNLTYSYKDHHQALTQMEAQLLKLLVERSNTLVKRELILEKIWGENDYFKGRSLDVFITRLRKYLKADSSLEIRNHHGVGFTLVVNY